MYYRLRRHIIIYTILLLISARALYAQQKGAVIVVVPDNSSSRIKLGSGKLMIALLNAGYKVTISGKAGTSSKERMIVLEESKTRNLAKEGYTINSSPNKIGITGNDASGVLYGCLELADEVRRNGKFPAAINITDHPEMVMRGTCIGLQKPYYLPGRTVYEYPYTPQTFPWFYDKKLWIQVLDSMLENRMNSLYLWNGHPFASLVRLKDYPYAVEVDDATFKKNEEMYRFLTTEADKRGIWVIQMFYNIIVSKPFAEKHKIKTQDRERPIIPLIADYTRKSIAAFVQEYPNVGLMVCLGEAMEGTGHDDIEWFTKTIIPGVQDGLKALAKKNLSA
ncbi:MAG: glycoside hydrolase family 20 zincin-like fold domain-containing protein, partial [Chitinophagales bacterium]